MPSKTSLSGLITVCFESRLSDSAASLLEKWRTTVVRSPSMQEIPLEENHEVFRFGEQLFVGDVDVLICMTGVGTRMLADTLETRYKKGTFCRR